MQYFNKFKEKMRKIIDFAKIFRIDFSFLLIFVMAYFLDELLLYFYFTLFTLFHELSHFFVAKKLGYYPKKIHLTFFGASLEGSDDFLISDEIKIVLAGPMFNLVMIVLCYLSFWFYPESYNFLNEILVANWSIFLFNFLPIYPLDFGRFLLACFSQKYSREDALKRTQKCSFIFLVFMFCLFLISFVYAYDFSLGFVCVNLASLMFKSSKDTAYKRQVFAAKKFEHLEKGLIERVVYVEDGTKDVSLFKFIDDNHFVVFVFVNKEKREVLRMTEVDLYFKLGLVWFIFI